MAPAIQHGYVNKIKMVSFISEINVQRCLALSTFNVDRVLLEIVGFRGAIAMSRCRPGNRLLQAICVCVCDATASWASAWTAKKSTGRVFIFVKYLSWRNKIYIYKGDSLYIFISNVRHEKLTIFLGRSF